MKQEDRVLLYDDHLVAWDFLPAYQDGGDASDSTATFNYQYEMIDEQTARISAKTRQYRAISIWLITLLAVFRIRVTDNILS